MKKIITGISNLLLSFLLCFVLSSCSSTGVKISDSSPWKTIQFEDQANALDDDFIDNNEFLISPLISFLRAKSDVSFPMIIQEFPEQKNILIDLSNDQNLISPDEGLKFIKQAVDYIERNQGDNLLEKLKIKYEKNELDSKEKIELKKLLTSKFEQLTEDELSLFKKL